MTSSGPPSDQPPPSDSSPPSEPPPSTDPPPPTDPSLPNAPTTTPELPGPIPAGKALLHVTGALLDVYTAMSRLEAVVAAIARALDETAGKGPTAP
ncbi:MAG: hypothetical protein WBY94_15805 [Polyangiaceae bacterium]